MSVQLAIKSNKFLGQIKRSELRSSIVGNLSESETFIEDSENVDRLKCKGSVIEQMEAIVNAPLSVEDAIFDLFAYTDHTLQQRAVEIYIRRLYQVMVLQS